MDIALSYKLFAMITLITLIMLMTLVTHLTLLTLLTPLNGFMGFGVKKGTDWSGWGDTIHDYGAYGATVLNKDLKVNKTKIS